MQKDNDYSRENDLQEKFNQFWESIFDDKKDYFKNLSTEKLIELKKAVHDINNIITLRVTNQFVDLLYEEKLISSSQAKRIKEAIDKQHPNTNGFDICFTRDSGHPDDMNIIAEIKCNIVPKDKKSYDANQFDSIISDIQHLLNNKGTSQISNESINDYFKFMVLLNGENVADAIDNLMERVGKNINKYSEINGKLRVYSGKNINLQKDVVYIVPIDLK